MISDTQEQETRRINILDGINGGFGSSEIASDLGVPLWVVIKDLKRMKHNRDPDLKQAYRKAEELVQAEKQSVARIPEEKFHNMTGMSLKEKTFSNMMSFYEPELRKILVAENECDAIRDLPNSVRRTLKHNGIIAQGWKTPEITAYARTYLQHMESVNK